VSVAKDPEFDERARLDAPAPAEPIGTERSAIGVVKWWKDGKGYGAIASADTAPWDIWFHFSALTATGRATLPSGEVVDAIVDGQLGAYDLLTGAPIGSCVFTSESPRVVQVGMQVEVHFRRANQESFKYVARRVRLVKP
jgi:cold shock CspA family protein